MQFDWLYVGAANFILCLGVFLYCLRRGPRGWAGVAVGVVNMLIVALHLIAPIRGVLDPAYVGYGFGLLQVGRGVMVTLVAGAVLIAALSAACMAVSQARRRAMLFVATVDALLFANLTFPIAQAFVEDPSSGKLQFGEYLTLRGPVMLCVELCIIALPLLLASVWAARRFRGVLNLQ